MIDYTIVVPSRKRSHNMPTIRELLPSAIVCVDEREAEDYAPFVPADKLLVHPKMDGFYNVYNWAIKQIESPCYINVGDDFVGIRCTTGSQRWITDPEEILAVLENSATACDDLGLTAFCYTRTPNTTIIHPDIRPIVPTQSVCNAFGVMNAARHREYDTRYMGRGDVDWTLETLLKDRCVYADVRFYFDCGAVFGGRGGNVGLVTPEIFENSSRGLKKKWGKSVSFKPPAFAKKRDTAAIRIAVTRTNKTAQK